ncbi:protein NPGR2-like [Cucumis melo]|uniref:Protein NPGR2-like n=1 Tax=Cucumis melo TaxID=3656 RepID=A0A1S3AX48_CUCME|nr:protein NPGR2-like [Cucumis melo]XP_008438487.1 protein NPGR2-like [Cucumis melo]XP_008438488.1 protein NPGR2-like [Cucumis melo]XP_008438489.1 protein NPGR2-like [Cucumis melo]XP_050942008.1 protein NPGR2-like [Cucumis melo]XP_050942009.1 protein NPGR2-like [Cucumis melo]
MRAKDWIDGRIVLLKSKFRKMINCIRSGDQLRVDEMAHSSDSLATRDYSASGFSSRTGGEVEQKVDNGNIEEAESSLRESGYLNYEEARALLGRLEYQKGNIEAALHVFEGIDIAAVISRIKASFSTRYEQNRRQSQSDVVPTMSMHAISLLLEAIFLKAKSLQGLGRFVEAAKSCKLILDTVESSFPEGLPENFANDCKLQETLTKAVDLLPELWKSAGSPQESILSYRRALLYQWNLEMEARARIEKEFAIFLLYSGCDASPPNLRSQMDSSFVPRNNMEEAILLLMDLMRKYTLGLIVWDPSVIEHLSFALSISGEFGALANEVEQLPPGIIGRKEKYCILALCYYGEGKSLVALNLLKNFLSNIENVDCLLELLLASKLCGENLVCLDEGVAYTMRVLSQLHGKCIQLASVANCLLGVLLSATSKLVASDSQKALKQSEALKALQTAEQLMRQRDPFIIYHLGLEYAEQRKLDFALYYAKQLVKLEAGSSLKSYVLLARILSAQKRFVDAETVLNAALEQTGKWEQGELLRTKAKLQIAQGQLKNGIETYSHLLAIIQVQNKSSGKMLPKDVSKYDRSLEVDTWHDLADIYTGLSQWRDAEICLSKLQAIDPYSASKWHSTGLLYESKGLPRDALQAYNKALDIDPGHVPSLISTARLLQQLGGSQSFPVVRSLLTDALRLDRANPSAWYSLGMLYKADAGASALEAAECFEAATLLEESAPIEPFRR